MATEVSKNEDGTWHAPGAGDHRTKREAQEALDAHQQELAAAREQRQSASDDPNDLVIAARPARRADLTGQGRTLDAVGNEV